MRKFTLFFIALFSFVFCISSCNSCKKDKAEQDDVKVTDTLNVENAVSVDREHMYLTYGENYRWFETCIVLKDFLDADSCDGSITGLSNVFEILREKDTGYDVMCVLTTHTPDTTVLEEKQAFWVGDFPLNDEQIKVTFKEAFDKVMATNSPKPHSRQCVLRREVGPVPNVNPQYIFGNVKAQLYVDAVTGDVTDKNPAFPEDKGFKMPLGEWP